MTRDFTHDIYRQLLVSLKEAGCHFVTVNEYFTNKNTILTPLIMIRHDVDRRPNSSLKMAKIEADMGVKATYYFRTISSTLKPDIIREIASLGHEIGYHYESLAEANGNYEEAIDDFSKNLNILRSIYPIKSIAMHGRPTSKWDSRWLWKKYDYKEFGIVSEPYFDINFNKVFYSTDAGRAWGDEAINLRDKVSTKFNFNIKHTKDLITLINQGKLPNEIMLNIHPEHWAKSSFEWYEILLIRKVKNSAKKILLKRKSA